MSLVLGKNPSNELTPMEVDNSGNLKVNLAGSSHTGSINVDITGNTIGLATSALQTTGNSSLGNIDTNTTQISTDCSTLAGAVSGNEVQCDIITSALPTGASTEATLLLAEAHLGNIDTATSSIQSNVATSALQTTGNTSLATIAGDTTSMDAKLPSALGQTTMANSLAVVIASNQSSIPVSSAGGSTTNANQTLAPGANGTATSTAVDMNGFANVQFFGNSTNTSDNIKVEFSHNNSNFFKSAEHFVNQDFSTGDYSITLADTSARYVRLTQTDTTTTAFTLQVNTSQK